MALKIPPTVEAIIRGFDAANVPLRIIDVGARLSIERQALKEGGASDEDEDFGLWCELAVFYVRPSFDDGENPWRSFFRPMSSMLYESGSTVYTPDISEANADAVEHWSRRAQELKHPVLRARYADVVWELGRLVTKMPKRDVVMALLAIDAYIEATTRNLASNFHHAFTDAQRAIDLASQIGDTPRINAAREALLGLHAKVMKDGKSYLWARAFDHLFDHRKASTTQTEMTGLVADLEIVLARVSDSTKPESFDPHATRDAATRLARHYEREGNHAELKRLHSVVGGSFEFIAGQGDAMQAASFLQDSLASYKQAGLHDDAERTRVALQRAIRESKDEMTQHSVEIEIPKDAIDKTIAALVVDSVEKTFANIAAAFVPKIADMEGEVAKLAEEAPLFAMVPLQIFAEDHVAAKVGAVGEDVSGRLIQHTQQNLQFKLPFLIACMNAAIDKHRLEPDDFVRWTNRESLFEGSKLGLLTEGVTAWFEKDHVKALHVLIPQIEHALRRMVAQVGKPTTKPAGTVPGVSVAINMGDILFNATTVAALGPLGPDLALYMKSIYADPRGLNLRNQFAHGLLDTDEIHAGVVLWLIHTLLVIGTWRKPD